MRLTLALVLFASIACKGSIGDVPIEGLPPICDGVECINVPQTPPEPTPVDRIADVGYRPLTHLQIANTIASRLVIFEAREMDGELSDFVELASHLRDQSATERALAPVPFIEIAPVVIRAVERLIPSRRQALFGECAEDDDLSNDDACRREFLMTHGPTFWRRPIDDAEADEFLVDFDGTTLDQPQMRSLLIGLMMSPNFLFVVEHGGAEDHTERYTALTAYELASRLSYFLWQDAPDAELLVVASDGSLLEDSVLEAQADRLLDDVRSEKFFLALALSWMHIQPEEMFFNSVGQSSLFRYSQHQRFRRDAAGTLVTDGYKRWCEGREGTSLASCQESHGCTTGECDFELRAPAGTDVRCEDSPAMCFRIPITLNFDSPRPVDAENGWRAPEYQARLDFYGSLHGAILDDLAAYVKYVVANYAGSVRDLFTLEVSAARDERLASIYEAPVWDGEGAAPEHPTGRGGLLGRVAFLGNAVQTTRPIIRGVNIWHHVLCREFAVPIPDNVVFRNPETDRYTTRERVEFSTAAAGCRTCHGVLNEFAFALEGFDMIGRPRSAEPSFRLPGRDGYGEISGIEPGGNRSEEVLDILEDWLPIDDTSSPELMPGAPQTITGALALGEAIADYQNPDAGDGGRDVYACLGRQLLRFGFDGAVVRPEEAQRIEETLRTGSIRDAIQTLVRSAAFGERDFGENDGEEEESP